MTIGRHCNGKYCVCCNKLLFKLFHIVVNRCCLSPEAGETQLLIGITGILLFYCSIYTLYVLLFFCQISSSQLLQGIDNDDYDSDY